MNFYPDFQSENDYRNHPAINYSLLKNFQSKFQKDPKKMKAALIGKAVDTILTKGKEEYYNTFKVLKETPKEPSIKILKILENCETWDDVLKEAKHQNFGKNWSDSVILERFSEYKNYYDNILKQDSEIITLEEDDKILTAVSNIKENEFLKNDFETEDDVYYQFGIKEFINGVEYKILLDYLRVNHKDKIIYPYDFKMHDNSYYNYVQKAFFEWRHDIQSSLYKHVLEAKYPDYKVENFINIVYSFSQNKAVKVDTSRYYDLAKNGYKYQNQYYKGWLQLTDDYLWHVNNQLWDYPREIYENNGIILC